MSTNKKIVLSLVGALILIIFAIFVRAVWLNYRESRNPNTVKVDGATFKVEVADSPFRRLKGLSGRESLPEDKGMLLVFDPKDIPSLWPKGMKFPIDIIWIDGTTVVGVDKGAEPEGNLALEGIKLYSPRQLVDKVLQINAGLADKLNIDSGSKIELNIKK
jgi:hypothetical protein